MLDLPTVTLCCIDTANHALALRALAQSRSGTSFARTVFLTADLPPSLGVAAGIDVVPIAPIASRDDYSRFVLKSLLPHVTTAHVLLVQWDGYVVNPAAWDAAFLDCDYIGAAWFWQPPGKRVGNGGFSLRSRRLLEALQDARIEPGGAEDETICIKHRALLESEYAIRYADESIADRFAFEAAYPIGRPFGFHGLFNFSRVVPPAELATLVPLLSDSSARSLQLAQLLRNCVAMAQWAPAVEIARRILAVKPDDGEARGLLAQAERSLAQGPVVGRNDPCPCGSGKRYKHCHGAAGAAPAASAPADAGALTPDRLVSQAMELHQRGDLAGAEAGYRAALAASPDHPHALHYLGVIRYQQRQMSEALPLLERAVERIPHEAEFHNNLGLAQFAVDRLEEAIASHRRAIALSPHHASAWSNLGLALQAHDELPEAIDAFRRAQGFAKDFAQAHWNLGLALLLDGQFAEGWREYDWRLRIPAFAKDQIATSAPRWNGSEPAGKTLLLTAEQGFGDTLQFARFAGPLAARGARVIARVQPELQRLIATVPGVASVTTMAASVPACDAYIQMLSVAGAMGVDAATIPHAVPYLRSDPLLRDALAVELEPYRDTLKIGLAWAGSGTHHNDRHRSCPLAAFTPLLELAGTTWFSLQRDDGEDQVPQVPAAKRLVQLDARRDFDRKAALIDRLDLVISVDTSSAHLAGALARPLWVLLPFAPDWRWLRGRADTPWYSTARLFRQPRTGDWDTVIRQLRDALNARRAAPR
jgi:tetratricopeptide (TPR) repeat protein